VDAETESAFRHAIAAAGLEEFARRFPDELKTVGERTAAQLRQIDRPRGLTPLSEPGSPPRSCRKAGDD